MQLESAVLSTRLSLCARVPNQNLAEKEVYLTLDASSLSYCILVHLWCVSPSPYVLITQEYHMSSAEASSFYKYFSGDLFSQHCWKKSYLFPSKHWFQGWAVSAHQECHFLDFGIREKQSEWIWPGNWLRWFTNCYTWHYKAESSYVSVNQKFWDSADACRYNQVNHRDCMELA